MNCPQCGQPGEMLVQLLAAFKFGGTDQDVPAEDIRSYLHSLTDDAVVVCDGCDWTGTIADIFPKKPKFVIGYCLSLEGEIEFETDTIEDALEAFDQLPLSELIAKRTEVVHGERYDKASYPVEVPVSSEIKGDHTLKQSPDLPGELQDD